MIEINSGNNTAKINDGDNMIEINDGNNMADINCGTNMAEMNYRSFIGITYKTIEYIYICLIKIFIYIYKRKKILRVNLL